MSHGNIFVYKFFCLKNFVQILDINVDFLCKFRIFVQNGLFVQSFENNHIYISLNFNLISMKTMMKKEYGYLIAAICFYIGAIFTFFSSQDIKIVLGSSFALLGIIFTGIFARRIKKDK